LDLLSIVFCIARVLKSQKSLENRYFKVQKSATSKLAIQAFSEDAYPSPNRQRRSLEVSFASDSGLQIKAIPIQA
jgi:hypothetical protein